MAHMEYVGGCRSAGGGCLSWVEQRRTLGYGALVKAKTAHQTMRIIPTPRPLPPTRCCIIVDMTVAMIRVIIIVIIVIVLMCFHNSNNSHTSNGSSNDSNMPGNLWSVR